MGEGILGCAMSSERGVSCSGTTCARETSAPRHFGPIESRVAIAVGLSPLFSLLVVSSLLAGASHGRIALRYPDARSRSVAFAPSRSGRLSADFKGVVVARPGPRKEKKKKEATPRAPASTTVRRGTQAV